MLIEAVCGCNKGKLRKNNEDNLYFNGRWLVQENNGIKHPFALNVSSSEDPLFCVFDGMGGENAGEVASFVAASKTDEYREQRKKYLFSNYDFLKMLCLGLNDEVFKTSVSLSLGRMGSTMVAALFCTDEMYVCNVGDSRVFRLRNNSFLQMSIDDSEILPPTAKYKPRLTQHLGIDSSELLIEPHITKCEIKTGDQYLLCSDGITDMLTNIEIYSILKSHENSNTAMEKLVNAALEKGGKDNITAVLCRVK